MIPSQTLENFPVFSDTGTKVKPDDAKYSAGFQQSDVLPAEWVNWEWNKASKGISDLNAGMTSVEKEIINVLTEAGISAVESSNDQLYKAIRKTNGFVSASSKIITGAQNIDADNSVKIMFTADITGSDTTTGLSISYDGTTYPVKVCKDGVLSDLKAHEITSGSYKYIQANTTIEFICNSAIFIVVGNPIVLSGAEYTIYADGKTVYSQVDSITSGVQKPITSNAVAEGLKYSTTETLTGSTWIDGKPVYRLVITGIQLGGSSGAWSTITDTESIRNNIDTLIKGTARRTSDNATVGMFNFRKGSTRIEYYSVYTTFPNCDQLILEYTKTTS